MTGRTDLQILVRTATADEHRRLFARVGWSDRMPNDRRAQSLAATQVGVVAVLDGRVVGMARTIGDGVHYSYLQDMVVDPDFQDHDVASALLDRLLTEVQARIGSDGFIGLFASPEAVDLYRSGGFGTDDMLGMHRSTAVSPAAELGH